MMPGNLHLEETHSITGFICLAIFSLAYLSVALEDITHIRKSKSVVFASGVIWLLVTEVAVDAHGFLKEQIEAIIMHDLMEYGELLLFLLVSMTYTNALIERNVFEKIRYLLAQKGLSFRQLFWLTGFLAFFLSAIANNLTTAMVMGAVVLACGQHHARFIRLSLINIVIAANAGGVFSPFGDVTTLMMWQAGQVEFTAFFTLFVPALLNFTVPAALFSLFLPSGAPPHTWEQPVELKPGAIVISGLFLLTIAISVYCEQKLFIPPFMGMMMGLSLLMIISYWLKKSEQEETDYDFFINVKNSEWDTLLFFYGIIFCIGGLTELGYLELASSAIYQQLSPTWANVLIGLLSAVVDNIPVMFSVLEMQPSLDTSQWLLVTLTSGVGGSLLSIGSAAGVALMGQSKGLYSFIAHLKWFPVILLGYAASIYAHLLLNA